MLTEDGLIIVLARLEEAAVGASEGRRVSGLLNKSMVRERDLQNELTRARRDLTAAENKVGEWAEYASQLRGAIDALDPRALRRKKIVLPGMPAPLETEIPF